MLAKKTSNCFRLKRIAGLYRVYLGMAFALFFICAPIEQGFAEEQVAASKTDIIEEIVVLGTRRHDGRAQTNSLVPVDVIRGDDLGSQGPTDMDSLLAALIPSYNIDSQPINDAATLVRPAKLRGLPPDSTLALVNGKRRHRASVITFLGNGVADGSQGADLSVIPAVAVKRVEVLRDGAAAQYGSDAIAGVINFELKDDAQGSSIEARWGSYYEGDGDALNLSVNFGLPLTDAGFANISYEYKQADPTNRSVQRSQATNYANAGNPYIDDPGYLPVFHPNVMVWGTPKFEYDHKFFANLGLDLGNGREAYAFGNYAKREVEGGFYYRHYGRGGVFEGPSNVVVDGVTYAQTLKVADLSDDGVSGNCSPIGVVNNAPVAAHLAAVEANPDCHSLISTFPGGFTPRFGGTLTDMALAFGVRGDLANDWYFDASGAFGVNDVDFFMRYTINPQLLVKLPHGQRNEIPINYFPGSYTQSEYVLNFDLSKSITLGEFNAHIAFGLEHRQEKFKVESGEENSWFIDSRTGGLADQGFGIGSNGFTGFGPRLAGVFDRNSYAVYSDLELELSDNFISAVAVRYEDHADVGSTVDGKLTARWQVSDVFALRGAVSTGFRAPTPGQANILNVTTAFTDGRLADEATLPPTHPASVIVGGKALTPEESINFSFGSVIELDLLDITVDFFRIEVEDRIARGSVQALTPADTQALLAQGVADAQALTSVRFYTNDFATTTEGVDLIIDYPMDLGIGVSNLSFAFNYTNTTVDNRNPEVINDKRVIQLEQNLPNTRFTLSFNHNQGPWNLLARVRHYGDYVEFSTDDGSARLDADARILVDAEIGYNFNDMGTLILGMENMFDEYPTNQKNNADPYPAGLLYAETSPFGFNGGFYYLRAIWNFN